MLVCLDSVYTLEIITRTLREVVNRERLCGTSAFYFSGFLVCLYAGILSHSGDHHAHSTRSGKLGCLVAGILSHSSVMLDCLIRLFVCLFVCLFG